MQNQNVSNESHWLRSSSGKAKGTWNSSTSTTAPQKEALLPSCYTCGAGLPSGSLSSAKRQTARSKARAPPLQRPPASLGSNCISCCVFWVFVFWGLFWFLFLWVWVCFVWGFFLDLSIKHEESSANQAEPASQPGVTKQGYPWTISKKEHQFILNFSLPEQNSSSFTGSPFLMHDLRDECTQEWLPTQTVQCLILHNTAS